MMIRPSEVVGAFGAMSAALRPGAGDTAHAVAAADGLSALVAKFPFGIDRSVERTLGDASRSFAALGAGRTPTTFHAAQVDMLRAATALQPHLGSADQAALGAALRHHFPG